MSPLIKNALFAAGLALLVWIGYMVFFQEDDPSLSASNQAVQNQAERDAQEFLVRLQQLRTIELDASLFSDPRFESLIDIRQNTIGEPVGRENPFTPAVQ